MALACAPPVELEDGEEQPRVEVEKEADAGALRVGVGVEERPPQPPLRRARGRGEADEAAVRAPRRLHASPTGRDQWRRAGG